MECVFIGVSFLVPSSSTLLMYLTNSSELYPCSIALSYTPVQEIVIWALFSDVQSLLMLKRFVWFVVLDCMEYCLLMISDVLTLYEGSSADPLVFYVFRVKFVVLDKHLGNQFLKFYTQIWLSRVLYLIRLNSE